MIYLDSAAVVKLVHAEPESAALRGWLVSRLGIAGVFVISFILLRSFFLSSLENPEPRYVVEVFPVSLGGRAFGLAQASNGVGKILGPICLALIAGSNDLVSPKATTDAVAPAFLFLAACELAALIAIFAFRREPHGKPMDIG